MSVELANPMSTGFPSLDTILGGGVRRGDLITLGGDAGSGKSSLALAIAMRMARRGARVIFHTTEMHPDRVLYRMLAMEQRKSVEELMLQRDDSPARGDATPVIPYIAVDEPQIRATTPGSGVDSLVHEMRPEAHFDLAVVDHLQSLVTDNKPLDEQLASAVRQLKALALQSNSAVLLVSHCHVDRSRTPVPRPSLADFGAHGAVQQQSDAVLGLYREEMYENARGIDGATELHILKNRHGGIGYVDLFFYKQWLRFEDMVDP